MALQLQGLPQISQDGTLLWITDKTGGYDPDNNAGGWGSPNYELDQSALLAFVYRKSNPKALLEAKVKYNASALNTEETAFSFTYIKDGVHDFNLIRLPVSSDDTNTIDTTPVALSEGDYWYNSVSLEVKKKVSGVISVVDLTNSSELDALLLTISTGESLLIGQLYYKDLAVKYNSKYLEKRKARREKNKEQESRLREDMIDIILGEAGSSYQYSFGFDTSAQDTIETMLDDYNL